MAHYIRMNRNDFYLNFLHLFGHVLDLLVEVLLGSLDVLLDEVTRSDINDLKNKTKKFNHHSKQLMKKLMKLVKTKQHPKSNYNY